MPNGTTHSAFERRGQPGDRRHRALDADVVAARRAAADADAAPAARQAVVGGAPRDGVVEIGRVEHVAIVERLEAFAGQPAVQDVDDPRAQRSAFITPPLKSTCVGHARPLAPRRIAAARAAAGAWTRRKRARCV